MEISNGVFMNTNRFLIIVASVFLLLTVALTPLTTRTEDSNYGLYATAVIIATAATRFVLSKKEHPISIRQALKNMRKRAQKENYWPWLWHTADELLLEATICGGLDLLGEVTKRIKPLADTWDIRNKAVDFKSKMFMA